ncbi:SusC/RagA family TonB-linked outer membrane protein [Arachidicoccus sp.]|uniref:SusC/RagA family TonB-linked outer membrane protein n=1 Tax=Arachidicoccus sp. TaxID=1872624 RepID=UPI003D1F53E1
MRQKLLLLFCFGLFLFAGKAFSQEVSIRGTVKNEMGEPISSASVKVKGTNVGTLTDGDGVFTIEAARGKTLEISFVGYETKDVPARNGIEIILQTSKNDLKEVVVTALGMKREKKALGYSVQEISGDKVNQGSNPNFATALEGKVAGVEIRPSSGLPGASAQIFIRGARFFSDNNSPLYVVDGMPISSNSDYAVGGNGVTGTDYSGRSLDIDPNDIASVSILEGQAASALYGTRASNGVIMITTKRGEGLKGGKPQVSFSTNWQMDQVSRYPDLQDQYAQGSNGVFSQTASTSWGPLISSLPNDPKYGGNVPNKYNNNNPTSETNGKYWNINKGMWVLPQAYDNVKDFFQNGLTASNNVSVSQGGELGNYYIGAGSTNQKGIMPSSKLNRYNFKFSGDFNVSSKVKIGANANYVSTDINKIPSGNNSYLFEVYGAPPSYDLKGTPISVEGNPYQQIQYRGGTFDNPYWGTKYNLFSELTRRVYGNAYVMYTPVKSLSIKYQAGIDQYSTDREELNEYGSGGSTGSITNGGLTNRTFNSLLNINYDKKINSIWHINALLGSEINDSYQRYISETGSGFVIPGFDNISNASTQTASEAVYKNRTFGVYAQAGADWTSMVFLNLTGRNDLVSSMPNGNRSFFYPSASLSWVFSELNGLKGKGFFGKIRASYAQVGAPGSYIPPVYVKHTSGSGFLQYTDIEFPFNGVIGFAPSSTLYDPNLKPQNTNSYELGTNLSFFNNRVGIDYTYTSQDTKDQIFAVPLAGSTGYSSIEKNAGEMSSKVHEASLRITPIKSKNFQWDINANFTKVVNKVVSLAPGVNNIYLGGFVDPQVRAAIGYTYPSIYGTTYLRNDKGEIEIDDDKNSSTYGMPLTGEDGVIGSVTPKFILGINNALRYKSIKLSFLVDWKNGGQIYSGANRLINLYGTSQKTANRGTETLIIKGVKASTVTNGSGGDANDIVISGANNFQTLYSNVLGNISEANVYGSSFVKLRAV